MTSRLVKKWTLEDVLKFLNSDEFDPLPTAEMKEISQKAMFLLTWATAARVSEIYALSTAPDLLTVNQNGSVTPLHKTTFIA